MADVQVDELSIKLSSTLDTKLNRNLDGITEGLEKLRATLANFGDSPKALSAARSMTKEFSALATSINSIDSDKIDKLSKAITTLATAGNKINKTFGGMSFSLAEKSAENFRSKIDALGKNLSDQLGVKSKDGIQRITQSLYEVSNAHMEAKKNGDGNKLSIEALYDAAKQEADAFKYVDDSVIKTSKDVLEFFNLAKKNGTKVLFSDWDPKKFKEDNRELGGILMTGQENLGKRTLYDHEFVQDLKDATGVEVMADAQAVMDVYRNAKREVENYAESAKQTSAFQQGLVEDLKAAAKEVQRADNYFAKFSQTLSEMGVEGASANTFNNVREAITALQGVADVPDMKNLKTMVDSISKITDKRMTAAVSMIPELGVKINDLASSLSAVKLPDLSGASALIGQVLKLGGDKIGNAISNLPRLSHALTQFAGAMENLPSIPFTTISDIGLIQQNISKYSNKGVQNAIPTLPQLGAAVKQLIADIASAPPIDPTIAQTIQGLGNLNAQAIKGLIQLSNESEKSAKKVNILTKAFKGIGSAGKGFVSTIGKGITALKNLRNHTTNLGQTGFAQLTKSIVMVRTALWGLQRVAGGFMDSINLASDLVEVNNVIDHVFGNYTTRIEEISRSSIQNFGISELTLKKYAGQFQAMGMTMGITGDMVANATNNIANMNSELVKNGKFIYENNGAMADMATTIAEWTADLASFYNIDYAAAAEKAQAIYTGQTRPLRALGIDLTQANLKAWALANGLNADIENMTQAEKAVLRFQYALSASSIAGSDFQNTIGTWSNQVRILKEQFNALKTIIGTGLISALKPFVAAMNSALSGVLKFAQNVLNALGKIFGWEVEIANGGISMDDSIADLADGLSDVGASGDDAASGTGKAAKALEEYKRQVLSFDELHMLSAPNENNSGGSGGSGGGGGAGGSGGAGGGGTGSAGDVSVAFKRTKALYESEIDTLRELGTYIADTLTSTLNNISWAEIQEKATGFGTGLADFLNGLFDTDTGLATALGNTVEGAINTAISAAFGFGNRFDFAAVGTDFGMAVDSAIDGIDWPKALAAASSFGTGVAKALNAFIKPKTFNSVGKTVANYIGVRITAALKVSENFKFGNLGTSIASAVNGALNTGKSQKYFKKLGQTVSNLIAGGLTTLSTFIGTTDWSGVRDAIIDVFSGFSWKDLKKAGQNLVSALFKAVVKNLGGDNKSWINVKTELKQLFEQIDLFGDKVGEGLKWFYDNVLEPMGKWTISEAIPNFLNTLGVALDLLNTVLDTVGPALKILWDGFLEPAIHFGADSFIDFWRDLTGVLIDVDNALESSGLSDKLTTLGNAMEGFADIYNNKVKPVIESLRPFLEFLRDIAIQYPGESFLGGISNAANIVSAISKAINGTGEETVNKNYRANVDVSLQKKGWNGFTSWLGGDATGDNNSGKLNTTNTVTNTGQKVKPYLTGNDDGKTETLNTALSMKPPSIETPTKFLDWLTGGKDGGKTTTWNTAKAKKPDVINTKNKFLNWLTGGSKGGDTSTTNTAKVKKSDTLSRFSSFLSWLTGGDKNGNTSVSTTAKVSPYYGGWGSLRNQITQSNDGSVSITLKAAGLGAIQGSLHALGLASGGIFSGGKWHDIAAYAGGVNSAPTGQLFLAREAGPELVGSLGNHTAVLNNDQIVASVSAGVYSAVRSAMSAVNPGGNNQAPVIEVIVKTDSETLYRQVKRGEKTYNGRYSTVATVM